METPLQKVLIVEDEAPILNGIADKFTFEGFMAIKARDGNEGLKQALEQHPDLILLDYRMPNADGLTLLEKLREDAWGKNARVIMWSNSHSAGTVDRAMRLGVLDFLIKSDWEYKDVVKKARVAINSNL